MLCFNKTDLSVKTENSKVETTVKLNNDPEKIKETITGQPRDKFKVCLEESNDNSKYCQTIILISPILSIKSVQTLPLSSIYDAHLDFIDEKYYS